MSDSFFEQFYFAKVTGDNGPMFWQNDVDLSLSKKHAENSNTSHKLCGSLRPKSNVAASDLKLGPHYPGLCPDSSYLNCPRMTLILEFFIL